jgi:hypothetical protein
VPLVNANRMNAIHKCALAKTVLLETGAMTVGRDKGNVVALKRLD